MLVGSLRQDSREELGSWTYVDFTLTRKLVWLTPILHPLFCVPSYYGVDSTMGLRVCFILIHQKQSLVQSETRSCCVDIWVWVPTVTIRYFKELLAIWLTIMDPSFALDPLFFCSFVFMNPMQHLVDHQTLSTCCHVGRCVGFHPFKIIRSPRPSTSSIKWTWTTTSWLIK
jgi:hypothetical protein